MGDFASLQLECGRRGAPFMNADKKYASQRLEGARRATARSVDESPLITASPLPAVSVLENHGVVATPPRRCFTAEDKLRILKLGYACAVVGSLDALFGAEGLYASNLTT
jgi:hypothetical protein